MPNEYIDIIGKTVAGIVYSGQKKNMKILLIKKKPGSRYHINQDSGWRFPSEKPKPERDSNDMETIERGLEEELDIYNIMKIDPNPVDEFVYKPSKSKNKGINVKVYAVKVKPDIKVSVNPNELDGYVRVNYASAMKILEHDREKESLKKFLNRKMSVSR